jgi:hypothetical protein
MERSSASLHGLSVGVSKEDVNLFSPKVVVRTNCSQLLCICVPSYCVYVCRIPAQPESKIWGRFENSQNF